MEEALDHLSPEERAERLNQWAQERAERLRMENAQYLELRRPRTTMFWNEVLEKKCLKMEKMEKGTVSLTEKELHSDKRICFFFFFRGYYLVNVQGNST